LASRCPSAKPVFFLDVVFAIELSLAIGKLGSWEVGKFLVFASSRAFFCNRPTDASY